MPQAARITDHHTCPAVNPGPVPHVGGPVTSGSPNCIIGGLPAARVGDTAACVPAVDGIAKGSSNVFINHRPAARIGDGMNHGGVIVAGCPTVVIGDTPQTLALGRAARTGAPFCEECERKKRKQGELRAPPPPPPSPVEAVLPSEVERPELEPPAIIAARAPDAPDAPPMPVQMAAREAVAHDFLSSALPRATPGELEAVVATFDLEQPLEVVHVGGPDAPGIFGGEGPFATPAPTVTPEALGLSPEAPGTSGELASRELAMVKLEAPVRALRGRSTSGAPQLFVPGGLLA